MDSSSYIKPIIVRNEKRIMDLQDLIDENIETEKKIKSRTFKESMSAIKSIVDKASELSDEEEEMGLCLDPAVLVLETELLRRNHEATGKVIHSYLSVTDKMFSDAISDIIYREHQEDWKALCVLACQHGLTFSTNASMLPFVDQKPKQKILKQRAAIKKKVNRVVETRPRMSDKLERKDEGASATISVLKQIRELYKSEQNPIPYYKLIIDPDDFMATVQNSLQISFLVNEKLIYIEDGEDGFPAVRALSKKADFSGCTFQQAIANLDVNIFEKFIKLYEIVEPMLKCSPNIKADPSA